jgi:hypothetical protein
MTKTRLDRLLTQTIVCSANRAAHPPSADKSRTLQHIRGRLISDKWTPDRNQKHVNDIGEDGFNNYKAGFMNFDGKYYEVPFTAGKNGEELTAYSIPGNAIRERRFPTGTGSSSYVKQEAHKIGEKPSADIIYSTEEKSQEVKSAVFEAFKKALDEKTRQGVDWLGNREETEAADAKSYTPPASNHESLTIDH